MAYNEKLTLKVRSALAHVRGVEEKRMFSGVAFMVKGKLCVSAGDDRIMCRIDPALHAESIKKKGCRTVKMKGREYTGYVYVKEESVGTKKGLEYWICLALEFNKKAKASKKSTRSSKVSD